jgi:hypothetical protein
MLKQSKFLSIKEQLNQLGYEVPRTLGSGGFGEVVLAVKSIVYIYFRWKTICY